MNVGDQCQTLNLQHRRRRGAGAPGQTSITNGALSTTASNKAGAGYECQLEDPLGRRPNLSRSSWAARDRIGNAAPIANAGTPISTSVTRNEVAK